MNTEQQEYLKQLADLLAQGKRVSTTSLCDPSSHFDWIFWRIVPEKQGVTFQIIGHYKRGGIVSDSRFLCLPFPSIYQIFGNIPLDPMAFAEDPNEEGE